MRRILLALLLAVATLGIAAAQSDKNTLEIIESSFRPEQQGVLEKVNIDPVAKDRSQRACARIKLHVNRMTSADIDQLQVHIAGGVQQLTKKVLAYEGNGLIIEMTAKPQTRFFLRHNIYGDSNEVCLNLEGDKVYLLEAQLNQLFPITVATNMKGADVYVDNRYCNKTNDNYVLIVQDITPGEHTLRIEHAGRRVEQKILVHRDNLYFRCDVDIAEARPQFVLFELEPKNAVVMIDGEVQSTQEGFVQALLPNGAHNYRIMAKGYHEQSGSFTVDGAKVTRKFVLKADAAMVTITAGGEGAEIWVNNERKGTSPWRGQLLSGNYLFEARKAGHRTTSLPQSITSNPAEQSYTLDAPTPIVGSVTITSVPAMADVFVDGKNIGQTPLYTDLLAGEHTLELRCKDYTTKSQKITVAEGKTSSLNLTLAKVGTSCRKYEIGNYYDDGTKQGVIFWIDKTGAQGKIISLTEPQDKLQWSIDWEAFELIGANDRYSGANNMAKVKQISDWQSKYPAFKWCSDLGDGWYLPATKELDIIMKNKSVHKAINSTLAFKGKKMVSVADNLFYWSSTEVKDQYDEGRYSADVRRADVDEYRCGSKRNSYRVRAVAIVNLEDNAHNYQSTTGPYSIGDYYNENGKEGVVFWLNKTGETGMIVSLTESSEELQWSSDERSQRTLVGADNQDSGAYNMAKVKKIQDWQSKFPAFKWCADLGEGWYLPATKELDFFMKNKTVHKSINQTLTAKGQKLADVADSIFYWSSTEVNNQYDEGRYSAEVRCVDVDKNWCGSKRSSYHVRAVALVKTFTSHPTTGPYKVGDYYNENGKEGVVFQVWDDGKHGKIVSLKEHSCRWCFEKDQKKLVGAIDENDGAENMSKVKQILDWESKYPAFKWCANLGEGWYLPAIEELNLFTLNKSVYDAVNKNLPIKLKPSLYWSSTEDSKKYKGAFRARYVHMGVGYTDDYRKDDNGYVRAVSAF